MISKLLSAAIKLFLRTQVDQVEDLQLEITCQNKQILQGYIPQVSLSCAQAVYQGLHLSQINLLAAEIASNLPEVVRGKPLKLLEPIWVKIGLELTTLDLQNSLDSDLLQSGLSDLWQMISKSPSFPELPPLQSDITWQQLKIASSQLLLTGTYQDPAGRSQQLAITTGLTHSNPHTLCLTPLKVTAQSQPIEGLEPELEIDLGTDVALEKLALETTSICCAGKIKVNN